MPELVICDTSALYYLHRLRQLDVLRALYVRIVVPDAVVAELQVGREQGEEVPDLAEYSWIHVRSVEQPGVARLATDLGAGEAEVLALALEHADSLVILDDRLARETARIRGLRVTGTLGVMLKAKQQGIVPAVAPLLAHLTELGFRMSDEVRSAVLKLASETSS